MTNKLFPLIDFSLKLMNELTIIIITVVFVDNDPGFVR